MDHLLLLFVCISCLPVLTRSDFLVEGLRNVQKRSAEQAAGEVEIYSVIIDSKVTSRFAHNVITSRTVNRANTSREVSFDVDLPKTAFITNFTMTIDGVDYPGIIKEKEVAKKQYEKAVSQGQSAGIVKAKASGRKTEKFTVSVNVASQSKVTFELIYEEMLKRHLGKYEMFIRVRPKKLVKNFQIDVDIYEPQGISFLDAQGTFITNELLPVIKKSFSGDKGQISFRPTMDQQRSCPNCTDTILDGDFTVTYDVHRESHGNIQVVNGYFVHFFAPSKLPSVPKNVVFVIDRSGSMYGRKMEQTKDALLKILDDVKEHDHFTFIQFDSEIGPWKDSLVKATPENLEEARNFVRSITARGMTNINDPIMKAVEILEKAHEMHEVPARSVSLIILLTDGEANTGESDPAKIQQNAKKAIGGRYTLYSLGFGYDVDYPFLEKLALENSGVARRIYEDSDAALQMQGFYTEIANPTLLDIEMQYPENVITDVTQNNFKHYFDGSEIVVAGRITDNDLNSFTADVKAEGMENSVVYTDNVLVPEREAALKKQQYIFGDFTERLWAYLTIQQLLEKRVSAVGDEKTNLMAEALDLCLKYQFVTPLTSMVVTKPEEQETLIAEKFVEGQSQSPHQSHHASGSYYPPTNVGSSISAQIVGSYYPPPNVGSYISVQNFVDYDPHFIVRVPERNDALCFNIQEKEGVVLNLVKDPEQGIAVNGELIGNKKTGPNTITSHETYFGKLGIVNKVMDLRVEVTVQTITVMHGQMNTSFSWMDTVAINEKGLNLLINKKKNILISMGDGATFVILLHKVWKNHPLHKDFLGFYTLDSHKFSERVHGLLGQFFHGVKYEVFNVHKTADPSKPDATMMVKNKLLTVTRGVQKDYWNDIKNGRKVPCWFVHDNGQGLIDGNHTDYIVPDLFTMN